MKNIFCIICRDVDKIKYDAYTKALKDRNIVFICDVIPEYRANNVIYIEDRVCDENNYRQIICKKEYTSWVKVFYYLKECMLYDYYWLIEDDVYLNSNKVSEIFQNCDNLDEDFLYLGWYKEYVKGDSWIHWNWNMKYYDKENLKGSLNPIVRLSYKMISMVLYERNMRQRFVWLEVMLASIVSKYNLKQRRIEHEEIDVVALYMNSVLKKKPRSVVMNEYAIVHPLKGWYKVIV